MKMIKVDGHRVCLVRTADGLHAVDHACPHEGYGLTQGELDGDLLTCAWHNWKFRVSDGACVQGEESVQTHGVHVADDGAVRVTIRRPDPQNGDRSCSPASARASSATTPARSPVTSCGSCRPTPTRAN